MDGVVVGLPSREMTLEPGEEIIQAVVHGFLAERQSDHSIVWDDHVREELEGFLRTCQSEFFEVL